MSFYVSVVRNFFTGKFIFFIPLALFLSSPLHAQTACDDDAIYVTPGGTGDGSKTSPANIRTALAICRSGDGQTNYLIKVSTGVHSVLETLVVPSNVTIDGNYDVNTNGLWKKSTVNKTVLSISPPGEEVQTLTSDNRKVTAGHYIGMRLDSVANVTLRNFTLEVHKQNSFFADMTYDGDGKSIYAIFGRKSKNILFANLTIVTDNAGDGLYGYSGLDGASADYNRPGRTVFDASRNTSYRPRPSQELLASYAFRAGGEGGTGGRVQGYYRCLDCFSTAISTTTFCAAEKPLPRGGTGGKGGGAGGEAGDNCEMDCYYDFYKSKTVIKEELLDLLSLPANGVKDPTPDPGQNGANGASYFGKDYTDQTIYPYDDINYYYIPGMGEKGGDGAGGGGGGGGGAGGIRTLGLVPKIPGAGDYNLPAKMLGLFNKAVTLAGGDDVCNAEIVNASTEGGAGGAGGEGGEGGGGGHGGGASIGVFTLGCDNVVDVNCTYTIGEGGRGGSGGLGGEGGEGGLGLQGNPVNDGGWSYQGAKGGNGGNGGNGSRGQHGSNGKSVTKIGVSTRPSPFISSDVVTGCTNSVISIYTSGGGFLFNTKTGSGADLNLVKDKPNGSSFNQQMSFVQLTTADTGRLAVSFSPPTTTSIQSTVMIKTVRPLPALNVPPVICFGQTLNLTAPVASAYSWKIFNANYDVVFSSDQRSISYSPPAADYYTVGYQAYDACCGASTPQYKTVKVSGVEKPVIKKTRNDIPYCFGTDSTKLEMISIRQTGDQLRWTGGGTDQVVYVKHPGWYTLMRTNADGCAAKSDSVKNDVITLPVGAPAFHDVTNACEREININPDNYEAGMRYNFYNNASSKTTGILEAHNFFFTTTPRFGQKEFVSYFVRKVVTYNVGRSNAAIDCISDDVREIKVYKEKLPPVVLKDDVEHDISSAEPYCGAYYTYQFPKAEDNCSSYIATIARHKARNDFYSVGTHTDTVRYIDISGNFLDYAIAITAHDVDAPVVTQQPVTSYIEIPTDAGACSAFHPFTLAQATDNCTPMPELTDVPQTLYTTGKGYSSVHLTRGTLQNNVFSGGMNVIRQTWSDSTGNVTYYEQTINVKDTEAPVLQGADLTFYVKAGESSVNTSYNKPVVTDNCSSFLTATFVSGFGQSYAAHPIGTTVETWKATDASGNVGYTSFKLTVLDTIAPSVDCSVQASAYTQGGTGRAQVTFATPSAIDNSGGTVVVTTAGPGSGDYFDLGVTPVTYTATDPSGNTASCSLPVTVIDLEGPAISCPANITVPNDPGLCGAVINFTIADALDNDGLYYTPFNVMGLAAGSVFPVGTTLEVFRVNDGNGNSAFCTFNVTVTDTEAPQFTNCPGNVTENVNPLQCGKMITLAVPSATDNSCALPDAGFVSGSAGGFFPVGVTHQVYRARDKYGNTATCEFDVTIIDNTTLSITCPPDVETSTAPGLCGATPVIQFPRTNIDYGCIEWKKLSTYGIGDMFIPGEHTVTYQATALGQTATCSFKVKVNDLEPPKIVHPENIVTYVDDGACGKVITFPDPITSDNCSNGFTFRKQGLASGSVFPIGTTVQQYVTTDILNADSATFTISVLDIVPPAFIDQPDIQRTTGDICGVPVTFTEPIATDNSSCFTITKTKGLSSGALFPVGTTLQEYVVRDAAGNTDTTHFSVVITSDEHATFNGCRSDIVVLAENNLTKEVWYDIPGHVSCTGVTSLLIEGKGSGATFPAGRTRETYVITDASGKSDTCSINVFVAELIPPYIKCPEPYFFDLDETICGAKVKFTAPEVDDFGGSGVDRIFNNLGPLDSVIFLPAGPSQIIWTAIDKSGNVGTCYNQIFVGKQTKPRNPIAGNTRVCEGSDVVINPSMTGEGPYTYRWSYYDPATLETVIVSTDSIFRIPSVKESDQRQYLFIVIMCDYTVFQREFLLNVMPSPVVTLAGPEASYCEYDVSEVPLTFSPAGGVLVGNGIIDGKFYPSKAGTGMHALSYTYYDQALTCPSTARVTVNVFETPAVKAFIDSTYCINNPTLALDETNSTYAGPGIDGNRFTAALAQAGTHTITRTVSVNGCENSLSQQVSIHDNVPDATILTTGPLCSNLSRVKLASKAPGGVWNGAAVRLDSLGVAYFNVSGAGLGHHDVVYSLVDGICSSSDTLSVEVVDSYYDVPYTFDAYCYDAGPVAFDTSDGKNYFGYGIANNIFNPIAYDTTTTALYGVSTVNARGCVDTVWRAMAVLKPELLGPNKLICKKGDPVELSVDNRLSAVRWFDNTTGYTKTVSDIGSYPVELHNTLGCVKLDTFYVDSKQAHLPPLINNTHELYKCADASAVLDAIPGFVTYAWSTGAPGKTLTVSESGEYTIYVTDDEDCELYDSIVVNNYSPIGNNQIVNAGTYLQAIASTWYAWYKNGELMEGETGQTLALVEPGDYQVALLDSNGCVSDSGIIHVILTSLEGEEIAECLIYPNPSKGKYVFQFARKPEEDLEITFMNSVGVQVKRLTISSRSGGLMYSVSLEDQPSGVYWAQIRQKDKVTTVRLVNLN